MKKLLAISMSAAVLIGCLGACKNSSESSSSSAQPAATTDEAAKTSSANYADSLFDTGYVHKINVELSDDDWKDLKANPLNKTKYSANVTIDGNKVGNVSFATKGNTSLSQVASSDSDRYSFKINFGKYEKGQKYQGLDKLNLNNIMSDATYMKDYLSYMIMREAGVSAPLASYAQLSVNGEVHGLYIMIEDVSDSFLERNSGDDDGALYKPETERLDNANRPNGNMQPPQGNQEGNMQPPQDSNMQPPQDGNMQPPQDGNMQPPQGFGNGQMPTDENGNAMERPQGGPGGMDDSNGADLVYKDDKTESYSDIFNNAENDVTDDDKKEMIAAIKALNSGENIEQYWDMDQLVRYFVAHNFVLNYDSYTGNMLHNYYLYEKDGKVSVFPWDYNLAFGGFQGGSDATSAVNWAIDSPLSGASEDSRPLWNCIVSNEKYLSLYHKYYSELMKSFFDSGKCGNEIERVYQMIRPYVKDDPTAFYTLDEFDTAVTTLKEFCKLRSESINKQLSGGLASTTDKQSKDAMVDASSLNISSMGTQGGGKDGEKPGGMMPNPQSNGKNAPSETLPAS